jgi:hypothetical protein
LDAKGAAWCRPRRDVSAGVVPMIDFTYGYIQRAADLLPKLGEREP